MIAMYVLWIVIAVNSAAAVVNVWGSWRARRLGLRAEQRITEAETLIAEAQAQAEAHRTAITDFVERVLNGDVLVTGDDGAVGTLIIEPVDHQNIRIHVAPAPRVHNVH